MTEAVDMENPDLEETGLDDLIEEWEAEQGEKEAEANKASPEDLEKARKLAEKMNGGFLWMVNRTQCPHVQLDQVIDREQGDEAFLPLAEKFGGEVPPWLAQFEPYIAAGIYMGSVIITARAAEGQALELIEQQKQGAEDGGESEPRA